MVNSSIRVKNCVSRGQVGVMAFRLPWSGTLPTGQVAGGPAAASPLQEVAGV